jgi:hypothetical protein
MIEGFRNLSYEKRLEETGLTTLSKRRLRADLIETFKIMKGIDKVDYNKFFKLSENNKVRGHSLKLIKNRSRLNLRKNFFSQRVINDWNKLPEEVISAQSVDVFKKRIDESEC